MQNSILYPPWRTCSGTVNSILKKKVFFSDGSKFQWVVQKKNVSMRFIIERGGIYMWMRAQVMPGISDAKNFPNEMYLILLRTHICSLQGYTLVQMTHSCMMHAKLKLKRLLNKKKYNKFIVFVTYYLTFLIPFLLYSLYFWIENREEDERKWNSRRTEREGLKKYIFSHSSV